MKHLLALFVVVAACSKGNEPKPAPAEPKVVPTVERDLISAVCAMTLLPSVHANQSHGSNVRSRELR